MSLKFGSLSKFPGTTGTYYYSSFFKHYEIEAEYKAFGISHLKSGIEDLQKLNYQGFSLSMPFKPQIIDFLSVVDEWGLKYNSCNTVVIKDSLLSGFNTDIYGVIRVAQEISHSEKVIVLGNGTIGKIFLQYLQSNNFNVKMFSRSLGNWDDRHEKADVLINCTSFGTSNSQSPVESLNCIKKVFDLTFKGKILCEQASNIEYHSGIFFYKEVFLNQFQIYTGIKSDPKIFDYFTEQLEKSQNISDN